MTLLIVVGYAGLVWVFGWTGLVLAIIHLAIMLAFTWRR